MCLVQHSSTLIQIQKGVHGRFTRKHHPRESRVVLQGSTPLYISFELSLASLWRIVVYRLKRASYYGAYKGNSRDSLVSSLLQRCSVLLVSILVGILRESIQLSQINSGRLTPLPLPNRSLMPANESSQDFTAPLPLYYVQYRVE
ncbi:hypothetical protein KQX54_002018 [Cotesia glomerata]|uniref:Uncharacterized protein n=1 Tax=Cotesia glomerata TaxID=32391 RepID=A0AAV7HWS1_COTGL|nr:hypothetical protein KQX54_002018 [Cotesia glomerata]